MILRFFSLALIGALASAQTPSQKPAPPAPPATAAPAKPAPTKPEQSEAAKRAQESEAALRLAIEQAGNDSAALVRKLEDYLKRFPDSPYKLQVYRALAEASGRLRDDARALDYAERIIAANPDDSAMTLFAVDLLEKKGDEQSLTQAVGYVTHVLDRIDKLPTEARPPRYSREEWESARKRLRMSVYLLRGRLEAEQHNYDAAEKDLETSYNLLPTAPAAERLGEIAEVRKNYPQAINDYLAALALPATPAGKVDRREVRQKLSTLWRQVHGSDAGLGDAVLATYDRLALAQDQQTAAQRNQGAKEPYAFVLRRLDGSPFPLSQLKGKVVVLDFWATWCEPCRELEPLLEQVAEKYTANTRVAFLEVNNDEDETRVSPYVAQAKIAMPVVFSDGLDDFLSVKSFPTIVVLDGTGKIVYHADGFDPDSFATTLSAAIERALRASS